MTYCIRRLTGSCHSAVIWDTAKPPAMVPTDVCAMDKLTVRAVYAAIREGAQQQITYSRRISGRNLPS
jgi:hypothetical protein